MKKVTLELPESIFIRNLGGKAINCPLGTFPESVLAQILVGGVKIISTNAFNGGGKDNPESARLAQMQKRWDAWARGEYVMVERGETAYTGMKEQWLAERVSDGMTVGEAEKFLKAKVAERLPKDSKATFSNFLDATALEYVDAGQFDNAGDAREALEAYYADKVATAEKARAKASAKITVPTLDLSAFKKQAK